MTTSRIEKSPHRGWSAHLTTRRHRQAQPKREVVGICVTSGDLGTHGMHPPRERERSDFKSQRQVRTVTRGRTRRSAPTRSICDSKHLIQHQTNVATRCAVECGAGLHQLEETPAWPSCRYARADTAVRPYAEDLFQQEASPQLNRPQDCSYEKSGDVGTHGMQPLRKRARID
jgi:hypothetical protein